MVLQKSADLSNQNRLILASGSPRRRELLNQIGVQFDVSPADIDESCRQHESPQEYVQRMAYEKAEVIADRYDKRPVLGADTSVVCNNQILGKPSSAEQAVAMLRQLSGQQHQVLTGVCLIGPNQVSRSETLVVTTQVQFRYLSDDEISNYVATEEPMDKAGSYGIQGFGAVLVESISGSYSNVVGLPLNETADLLRKNNISIWHSPNISERDAPDQTVKF